MSNPKLAIDALLETKSELDKIPIYPLTVARYALLELVDSPFLGKSEFNYLNIIPTWYVMTKSIDELKGYNSKNIDDLKGKALEESERIKLSGLVEFTKIFAEKLMEVNKVAPEGQNDGDTQQKGKKVQTAG